MDILYQKRKAQGFHFRCSDSPDTSGQNAAALQQAELSKEQLEWAKQIYAETAPDRAAASQRAALVSDAQLQQMLDQTAITNDYAAYQKDTFRPLEQGIVDEAAGYDTPERREALAGQAMADVGTQVDAQRGTMMREAEARGVDPSSGNFAAGQGALGVRAAAAQSAAGNAARQQVETIGAAKKQDAANLGRNLPSNQATSAGLALSAGNSAVSNANAPLQIAGTGAQLMNSGYGGAQTGLSNAANTYGAMNGTKSGDSGVANLAGAALGAWASTGFAWSDRRLKRDVRQIGTTRGGTNIYAFKYLWDDQEVIGVMADEVPHATLDVGGFKMVDYRKVA